MQAYYECHHNLNFLSKIIFVKSTSSDILIKLMDYRCNALQRPKVKGTFKSLTLSDSLTGDSVTTPESPVNVDLCCTSEQFEKALLQHGFARILYGQCMRPGYPDVQLNLSTISNDEVS